VKVLLALVAGLHLLGWGMLLLSAQGGATANAISLGAGVLAYLLGLRHAFDADHIAAIDNSTRRLLASGKQSDSVGFFFSLGHSSVVFVTAVLIAVGFSAVGTELADENSALRQVGGTIGGLVAGSFLLLIAGINISVLIGIVRVFRKMKHRTADISALDQTMNKSGVLARILQPLLRAVDAPWKMYPLGILFGLGFDTASSIAIMVMAGSSALAGGSFLSALALPLIFAAGMSLGDTADSMFMSRAYQWAADRPIRRAYYNAAITFVSVAAAIAIAIPLLTGVIVANYPDLPEPWTFLAGIDLEYAGFVLVAVFAATWATAVIVWKYGRFEQRWTPQPN
jgi:nickel/cobalt transporter (NiCoT) family protein